MDPNNSNFYIQNNRQQYIYIIDMKNIHNKHGILMLAVYQVIAKIQVTSSTRYNYLGLAWTRSEPDLG